MKFWISWLCQSLSFILGYTSSHLRLMWKCTNYAVSCLWPLLILFLPCSPPTSLIHLANRPWFQQTSSPSRKPSQTHLPFQPKLSTSSLLFPSSRQRLIQVYQLTCRSAHYSASPGSGPMLHSSLCPWLLHKMFGELNWTKRCFFASITYHWIFATVFEINVIIFALLNEETESQNLSKTM